MLILIIAANLDEQQQLLPASIHNSRPAAAQLSVVLRIVDPCVCWVECSVLPSHHRSWRLHEATRWPQLRSGAQAVDAFL
jgi:hypothetical protein